MADVTPTQTNPPQPGPLPDSGVVMTSQVPVFSNRFAGYDNQSPVTSNNPYPVADVAYGPDIIALLSQQNELLSLVLTELQTLNLAVSSLNLPAIEEPSPTT